MRRAAFGLVVAIVLGGLVGCSSTLVSASDRIVLDLPWHDYQRVVVRTVDGQVDLACGTGEQLQIRGVKRAGGRTWAEASENLNRLTVVARPDETDATTFRIELEFPDELRSKAVGADFDIRVPKSCAAEVATENGAISVSGLKDTVQLSSANGRIAVDDVAGAVEVDTSNGRITVQSVKGDCRLRSSNGSITAHGVEGSVRAETSNGEISVKATPTAQGEITLRTSNGAIQLVVPKDLPADLHFGTSNGCVRVPAGLLASRDSSLGKRAGSPPEKLDVQMNGGGCRIEATTSNGSITLETR